MKKIIINLNQLMVDLDGKEIDNVNIGKTVGAYLAASNKGDAIKYVDWALSFHSGVLVEVDKSDFDTIKAFIKTTETLSNLLKSQVLRVLDKAEKESEKPA